MRSGSTLTTAMPTLTAAVPTLTAAIPGEEEVQDAQRHAHVAAVEAARQLEQHVEVPGVPSK